MERLKDKAVIITGAAAGIGKTTAQLFLNEGARVMLVDVNREQLEETLRDLDHPNAAHFVADVSKATEVQAYVAAALKAFGKIDVFFNNAGIEGKSVPLVDYPEDLFDKVIAINLKGVWLGCKYVMPEMSEGGSVMITSSVAGLKGFTGLGPYTASKHGVVGIMRVAALEFAEKNIRVNSIHPGPVNTQMMRRIETDISPEDSGEAQKGFVAMVPLARYGEANEIAELALFLASDESRYITGSTHVIDGGLMA